MERTPRELSPEADEHPRRRGLWFRLVRWLQGDEEGRLPASQPDQAPSVQPTLEALIPATAVPEAPTAEPAVEKHDDDVPAAALGPAEDDVTTELHAHDPAAELPADDAATDCPADEPAPEAHGTGSEPEATGATEEPGAVDAEHAQSVLEQTLDTLGSAHHRPFSRG
jgi:hypothetical protein